MDQTSNDQYTSPEGDLGQDIEFDFDDDEFDEDNDLMRLLVLAGGVAALVGGAIILRGRRRRTPTEQLVAQASATVDDVRTAVEKADLGGMLTTALDKVNSRVRDVGVEDLARRVRRSANQAAASADLEGALGEIQQRLGTIEREGRRGARRAQREARRAFKNLDLGDLPDDLRGQLTELWAEITDRAQEVGWQEAIDDSRRSIRRLSRNIRHRARDGGGFDLAAVLAALAASLGAAQEDLLPQARKRAQQAGETLSTLAEQARKRSEDLAGEYAPQVQAAAEQARKRSEEFAGEYAPQVRKQAGRAAESAGSAASQLGNVLRLVALEALNRLLTEVLPAARKGGEQVADTVRDDTLPWIRHRAGEVRDRIQDDVAPKVAEVASEAPGRVREAVGTAAPVVGETLGSAASTVGGAVGSAASTVGGAVGDTVARVRPKAGDAASAVSGAVRDGSSGVGGALSTVGKRAGDAVGTTVDTTMYVTGETGRILFWLSLLAGLVLMVFIPDRERQQEIWNNVHQFLGEMRNMWGDLTGEDFDAEQVPEYTGDAGV